MAVPRFVSLLGLIALAFVSAGCAVLREDTSRIPSQALASDLPGRLATLAGRLTENPDEAAFRLLESGRAALTARLALAERAEHSLDLQYYIYRNDTSGRLLSGALLHAADRGVRVRLLLDDMYVGKDEASLIGLDAHPNVEVRLYNPFRVRGDNPLGKVAEFLGDKDRLNRRMHNKLLIADNQLAITGGRNIGDEYFQVEGELAFRDLDVLAAGRVVQAMSAGFDAYWNSAAAVPARAVPKPRARDLLLAELRAGLEWNLAEVGQDALFRYMGMDVLGHAVPQAGVSPWWPGRAEFLFDPPEKADDSLGVAELPTTRLLLRGLDAKDELLIASPYFIPGRLGLDLLTYLRHRGTRVRVLTNSLAANDVAIVHAGYARYRLPLLLAGIELHELKRAKVGPELRTSLASGASRTSLHSKVLVFDRASAYIGSMNLDPRSVLINTEAGLIIHNPGLAGHVAGLIEAAMAPANSYRLRAQPIAELADNPLLWSEERNGQTVSHDREPGTSAWQRWLIQLLAELPIEGDL